MKKKAVLIALLIGELSVSVVGAQQPPPSTPTPPAWPPPEAVPMCASAFLVLIFAASLVWGKHGL